MAKWINAGTERISDQSDLASAQAVLNQLARLLSCDTLTALRRGRFLRADGQCIGTAGASQEALAMELLNAVKSDTVYVRTETPGSGVRGLQLTQGRLQVTQNSLTLSEMGRRIPFKKPPFRLRLPLGKGHSAAAHRYAEQKLNYEIRRDTFLRVMNYAPVMSVSVRNWKENHLASLYVNKVSDHLFMNPGLQPKVLQFRASHDLGELITTPEATGFFDCFCRIRASRGTHFSLLDLSSHCVAAHDSADLIQKKLQEIQSIPSRSADLAAVSEAAADLLQAMEARFDPEAAARRTDAQERMICENHIRRLFATDAQVQNYLITKLCGGTCAERAAVSSMREDELLLFCRLHRGSLETVDLPQAAGKCRQILAAEKAASAARQSMAFLSAQFRANQKASVTEREVQRYYR